MRCNSLIYLKYNSSFILQVTRIELLTFQFHALEKEMATHSSVLAWRIPGTREPGGLLSMGLPESNTTEVTWQQQQDRITSPYISINTSQLIKWEDFLVSSLRVCIKSGAYSSHTNRENIKHCRKFSLALQRLLQPNSSLSVLVYEGTPSRASIFTAIW